MQGDWLGEKAFFRHTTILKSVNPIGHLYGGDVVHTFEMFARAALVSQLRARTAVQRAHLEIAEQFPLSGHIGIHPEFGDGVAP